LAILQSFGRNTLITFSFFLAQTIIYSFRYCCFDYAVPSMSLIIPSSGILSSIGDSLDSDTVVCKADVCITDVKTIVLELYIKIELIHLSLYLFIYLFIYLIFCLMCCPRYLVLLSLNLSRPDTAKGTIL